MILQKLDFSPQIIEKCLNIKFNQNLSSGSPVVQCGWTDRWADGRTDKTWWS